MEASENPQLPLDEGPSGAAADGVVRAIGDRLMIEGLTVTDERAARVVRERAEAGQAGPDTVAKAIEIGARVLDSEETAVNVDYVRAELERQSATLADRLTKTPRGRRPSSSPSASVRASTASGTVRSRRTSRPA